jgi:hypothetical protein
VHAGIALTGFSSQVIVPAIIATVTGLLEQLSIASPIGEKARTG